MIPAVCIDSDNKPEEVDLSEWINKGANYHITHIWFHPHQGVQGCSLKEVRLTEKSDPYRTFALKRFAVTAEAMQKLVQMMRDCSELNDFDIYKLIRESELETVEIETK
ncbi:MAG: hypothetical protein V4549_07495 [Bacteroidota bacterium]